MEISHNDPILRRIIDEKFNLHKGESFFPNSRSQYFLPSGHSCPNLMVTNYGRAFSVKINEKMHPYRRVGIT